VESCSQPTSKYTHTNVYREKKRTSSISFHFSDFVQEKKKEVQHIYCLEKEEDLIERK